MVWKSVTHCPELTFLGITNKGEFLPESLRALHIILWKMIVIEFTRTGMEHGKTFKVKSVFPITMRRMQTRINALVFGHLQKVKKAARHKRPLPSSENINGTLFPIARVDGDTVTWNQYWIMKCNEHDIPHNMRPCGT